VGVAVPKCHNPECRESFATDEQRGPRRLYCSVYCNQRASYLRRLASDPDLNSRKGKKAYQERKKKAAKMVPWYALRHRSISGTGLALTVVHSPNDSFPKFAQFTQLSVRRDIKYCKDIWADGTRFIDNFGRAWIVRGGELVAE
jgi:hypothetical protein